MTALLSKVPERVLDYAACGGFMFCMGWGFGAASTVSWFCR